MTITAGSLAPELLAVSKCDPLSNLLALYTQMDIILAKKHAFITLVDIVTPSKVLLEPRDIDLT